MLALNGGSPLRTTPFPSWPIYGPGEEKALLDVLHSGRWFLDEHIERFERDFASFQEAKFGIATSNGTTALQVALNAIGIRPGDEVIVPAYTFIATASAVVATGGIPIFADIDPATYNIDPQSVADAISEKTLAIIGVAVGEMVGGSEGLGAVLIFGGGSGNTALTFVAIIMLTVVGILAYVAVVLVEKRVLHYLPRSEFNSI